ncbi:hypothetical protein [Aquitalea denitrificans]|uniref:hypothetical protein n=1 Tax=Aquitalea denitrificans TaxID=519081 RepID=UPI001356B079|nr:hypothetical protein [Aquitalea denitrificans]
MRQDMRLNASRIIRDGYAYIQMPKSLLKAFDAVSSNFDKITLKQKENFSFPKETEGFLSFGN